MTYLIEVTQEDIDKGVAKDCSLCPVALAVMRATGTQKASVSDLKIGFYLNGLLRWVKTPRSCVEFIHVFDTAVGTHFMKPVPFSFQIEVPD